MEYKNRYGKLFLEILEDGDKDKVKVVSTVPFKKFDKEFSSLADAKRKYKSLKKEIEAIIKEMEEKKATHSSTLTHRVVNLVEKGFRKILLYSPTGTGKTFASLLAMKKMKEKGIIEDYLTFTFSSGMEDLDLLGKYLPNEKKGIEFSPSKLFDFLKKNKGKRIAVLFDEFNRAHSKALNILIPLLDGRNKQAVLENYITGEDISYPVENVVFFFTANFGGGYSGAFHLDDAILNRIEVSLFVDYQKEIEKDIIGGIPSEKVRKYFERFLAFVRDSYKKGEVNPFSTRDVKTGAILLSHLSDSASPDDVYQALLPLIYKIVKVEGTGYPDALMMQEIEKAISSEE